MPCLGEDHYEKLREEGFSHFQAKLDEIECTVCDFISSLENEHKRALPNDLVECFKRHLVKDRAAIINSVMVCVELLFQTETKKKGDDSNYSILFSEFLEKLKKTCRDFQEEGITWQVDG